MDNVKPFKLEISFVTPDGLHPEHISHHYCFDDAYEEANDQAFKNVGFSMDSWDLGLDFGEGRMLYYFYPNDDDRTSRYRLTITKEI
jgi:hypothetical protein